MLDQNHFIYALLHKGKADREEGGREALIQSGLH